MWGEGKDACYNNVVGTTKFVEIHVGLYMNASYMTYTWCITKCIGYQSRYILIIKVINNNCKNYLHDADHLFLLFVEEKNCFAKIRALTFLVCSGILSKKRLIFCELCKNFYEETNNYKGNLYQSYDDTRRQEDEMRKFYSYIYMVIFLARGWDNLCHTYMDIKTFKIILPQKWFHIFSKIWNKISIPVAGKLRTDGYQSNSGSISEMQTIFWACIFCRVRRKHDFFLKTFGWIGRKMTRMRWIPNIFVKTM